MTTLVAADVLFLSSERFYGGYLNGEYSFFALGATSDYVTTERPLLVEPPPFFSERAWLTLFIRPCIDSENISTSYPSPCLTSSMLSCKF